MSIISRAEKFARYIVDNNSTIRKTAQYFKMSKSTVHNDLNKKLENKNYGLYLEVKKILLKNFNEKHIRGGESTRNKYKKDNSSILINHICNL